MKIQLKRSNVIEGGAAKEPTAAQMEYGELAVNYSESDPAVFIKDSNDNIIRIAGNGANGGTDLPDSGGGAHQPGTIDDRYVELTGDNMTGDLTLGTDKITLDAGTGAAVFKGGGTAGDDATTANGLIARNNAGSDTGATIWAINKNANGYVFVGNDQNVNTTSTISNDGSATFGTDKITLDASDGTIHGEKAQIAGELLVGSSADPTGQVNVTFNSTAVFDASVLGWNKNSAGYVFAGYGGNGFDNTSFIKADGSASFNGLTEHKGGVKVTGGTPASVVDGVAKSSGRIVSLVADSRAVVRLNPNDNYDLQLSPVVQNASGTLGYGCVFNPSINDSEFTTETNVLRAQPDLDGLKTPLLNIFSATYLTTNTKPTEVDSCTGFNVAPEIAVGSVQNTAFRAGFADAGQKNFNFYADGFAPNYLRGNTYIGGTSDDLGVSTKINLLANGRGEFEAEGVFKQDKDGVAALSLVCKANSANATSNIEFFGANRHEQDEGYASINGYMQANGGGAGNKQTGYLEINGQSAVNIKSGGVIALVGDRASITGECLISNEDVTNSGRNATLQAKTRIKAGSAVTEYAGFKSELILEQLTDKIEHYTTSNNGLNLYAKEVIGYKAQFSGVLPSADSANPNVGYGFYSNIAASGQPSALSYNFYAESTAKNYFAGEVEANAGVKVTGQSEFTFSTGGNGAGVITVDREGNAAGNLMIFKAAGVTAGSISLDGSGGINVNETSDYRLKENVTNIESTVDLIKNLRPVNYNYTSHPGATRQGFIAHELQQSAPLAVTGTKDATEAIGTLADYDGTVLETAVAEPDDLTYTEEVETDGVATMVTRTKTWTATGTQPVYQGVDQTKLIPLLTKALQEALDKIEALETRLSDAGIA